MKKETTISILKKIQKDISVIRIGIDLIISSQTLMKSINERQYSWSKITDDGKKKTSELLDECNALFPTWSYYSNKELDKDFPPPKKFTTRQFQESIEPDEETLGKPTREADSKMQGITLRERIILELQYFKKTGQHLDIKGITFCSGSRYSDGDVPDANWSGGKFKVGCSSLDDSYSDCGIRSVSGSKFTSARL